jgi:hypothetical protein
VVLGCGIAGGVAVQGRVVVHQEEDRSGGRGSDGEGTRLRVGEKVDLDLDLDLDLPEKFARDLHRRPLVP